MKPLDILLSALVIGGGLFSQTREKPYDITARDDKDPWMASFQTKTGTYAVSACDEFGFVAPGAKIETQGCTTRITFDFKWPGNEDFFF